ncbi:MAG: YebC/PmpR family DNA-binding transcriptional regulator [Sulfobacillus acidophilus]|uniref:Probable transcriptional regulatory protein C7B45_08005 n=1 Tax=Sulfobacillus acidophilus TaxID=53633 RepID=A0A2T2WIU3_9FIRM|nr:MAG: YebC/PmpR family DNA-binding transcriptional regulator [Sulfobacillus acidophilus]
MSGHSKWANIKRKKAKVDAVKGTVFSRLTKEIMSAAKRGGGNPDTNFRLRLAIDKAKANNLPSANIERAIRRATGQEAGVNYEETVYEGYGPGGTAVYLDILTDNRNRTAGEIRHIFSRHGGSLGETGCVAWMFEPRGRIVLAPNAKSEEELLDLAIDAGADDLAVDGDEHVVTTSPDMLDVVRQAFVDQGIGVDEAELVRVPKTTVAVSGHDAEVLVELLDLLEDHDDVQHVYANADLPDEIFEEQ